MILRHLWKPWTALALATLLLAACSSWPAGSYVQSVTPTDAAASCDKQAVDKKIFGAAKTSFTKKCTTDATGT